MELHLIRRDRRFDDRRNILHHLDGVVRNADFLREPALSGLQQQRQRRGDSAICRRPMQKQDIDPVDLQILQALLDRGHEPVLPKIFRVHLGRDAEIIACDAGGFQRLAGLGLVSVHLRGIESAVADLYGGQDRFPCQVASQRESAECAQKVFLEIEVHRNPDHPSPKFGPYLSWGCSSMAPHFPLPNITGPTTSMSSPRSVTWMNPRHASSPFERMPSREVFGL